ncbi:DNA-binding CsgD family transcriptional regulator [Phycicoccus badiiscoriae]|uniref:DNA-binding CsgD family transcriptional regulator n=1 Tax=Pedococcus badiiscoriae TaxID=642776 RepID=A0A852WCQ1_9MICO|nr:AAA family ATPase [Pedococcus badiiscoriae]NYG06569.1 DNA-binding CsgD family transcriptional regulator [Pedococcus badiiscoriae]
MGSAQAAQLVPLVGRGAEQGRLAALLDGVAQGTPGVLLVGGEAGVGKTALVRDACARFSGQVLWGTCVHFVGTPVPFAAVVSALEGWLAAASGPERVEVLSGLDALRALLPSSPSAGAVEPGVLLTQLDAALLRIAQRDPLVLVVDDLQWADPSTLDLLAFLVAGLGSERVGVIATVRDEDRPDGHLVNGWVADLRRMPPVSEVHLERLGEQDTADQVETLLGAQGADPGLGARVYARSGGNPYLTELIAAEPAELLSTSPVAEALRAAVLLRWHGLSEPARGVTRVLAIGGRPVGVDVLEGVVGLLGDRSAFGADVREGLAEGVAAGVLAHCDGGRVWFRHPLIADILTGDATGPDPSSVHSAYAKVLAHRSGSEPGDVASHHELAGEWTEAYRWSLTAAQFTAAAQGFVEHLQHLQRACGLWPRVRAATAPTSEYVDLLLRTSRAAQCVAEPEQALSLIDEALSLTERADSPALACRLLTLRHRMQVEAEHLAWTGVTTALREAEQIVQSLPGTAERAIVDSSLAWTEIWAGRERGRELADEALRAARATGSPDALIPALVVSALAHPASAEALGWLEEAYELARVSGAAAEMADAALGVHNLHQAHGQYAAALESGLRRGADLFLAGAPVLARFVLTSAAYFALCLGQWETAQASLRPALAAADGGHREAVARATMAILCARRGELAAAQRQLDRAAQISTTQYMGTATYPYGAVELLLAQRKPDLALDVVDAEIGAVVLGDPRDSDELLVLAARAAADLAQDGRDRGQRDVVQVAQERLRAVLAAGWGDRRPFTAWDDADLLTPAVRAMYEAELARLDDRPDQAHSWARAHRACQRAGRRWDEAVAAAHEAHAALRAGQPRPRAAELLREAMGIALELGAAPLRRRVETTAAAAHLVLEPIAEASLSVPEGRPWTGLTPREQEVLAHVVAGRSNTEIAKALFISDKTVSVHISNILRKSGTTSRVDAAAWATRLADAP